jgi:2-polyprenyl-3-methyl-5-hydroxy-6-metoxy-1,4-benzoquinol methylase
MRKRPTLAAALASDKIEHFVMQNHAVASCVDRISRSFGVPLVRGGPITGDELEKIARDSQLRKALQSTLIRGLLLELFFTYLRKTLLRLVPEPADDNILSLFAALAQQCFINEYIYLVSDDEARQIATWRALIVQQILDGANIEPLMLAAVAAYQPLHSLPDAERLLGRKWPQSIAGLLVQQISEPLAEKREQSLIPAITGIDDSVSLQVRHQYEQNPYPRWTSLPPIGKTEPKEMDVLVAGCGTGMHVFDIAQRNPKARILAIDISLASLAYAKRKAREVGLQNVEFAQADILKLGGIKRQFDHIEAVGVLHHLADPEAGWLVLLSLLRPKGTMYIGLYSQLARRAIVDARAIIASEGYQPTSDDIRAMRQMMMRDDRRWNAIVSFYSDFYYMSGCRDLLFNVMEHRFSIPNIAAFLKDQNLKFLGFELPAEVIERFEQQYHGKPFNLDCWHAFEQDNPNTFRFMYQFTVFKQTA